MGSSGDLMRGKVCIITERFYRGGLEEHINSFIRNLAREGYDILLIVGKKESEPELPKGAKLKLIDMKVNPTREEFLRSVHELKETLLKENCSFVVIHPFFSIVYGFIASVLAQKPYALVFHGPLSLTYSIPPSEIYRYLLKHPIRYARKVYAVSQDVKSLLNEIFKDALTGVFPNLLDEEILKKEVKFSPEGHIILLSTFHYVKLPGLFKFLKLFKELPPELSRPLYIYGDGEGKEKLRDYVKELGISDRVKIEGFLELKKEKPKEPVFFGVAGARSALELLGMNIPTLLLGVDGVKGFVSRDNFREYMLDNLSGLYAPDVTLDELKAQIRDLKEQPQKYRIADIVRETLAFSKFLKNFEEDLKTLTKTFNGYDEKAINSARKFLLSYFSVESFLDPRYAYNIAFFSDDENELLALKNVVLSSQFVSALYAKDELIAKKEKEKEELLTKISELRNELERTVREKKYYENKLNEIYTSRFWKLASRYYSLRGKLSKLVGKPLERFLFLTGKKKIEESLKRTKRAFVYPPTVDWNIPLFQRPQHMCIELSKKDNTVVFCTLNHIDKIKGIKEIRKNLYISSLFEDILREVNSKKDTWLFFPSTNNILTIWEVRNFKKEGVKVIYDYIDEIHPDISPEINIAYKNFKELKDEDVDLITCVSRKLYEEMLERFPKEKVLYLPNGVEYEHFQVERDLSRINDYMKSIVLQGKPVIGYYGALASWIDYELIACCAEKKPEWNFVLIGVDYDGSLSAYMRKFPQNVHYLGVIPYRELPHYAIWFDVALIPFRRGEIARSTSPIKMYEYMALKKPIVATEDLVECYGYEGVLIAKNECGDFTKKVETALSMKDDKEIIEKLDSVARQNTWEKRAQALLKYIERYEKEDTRHNRNET